MAQELEPLNLKITGNANGLSAALGKAQGDISGFTASVRNKIAETSSASSGLISGIAARFGPAALATAFVGAGVAATKLASENQDAEITFKSLTGSIEKARETLAKLSQFATKTPFEAGDVKDAAKALLVYKFSAEELESELTLLGNVASVGGAKIEELAVLVGRARSSNLLFTEDLNQFSDRGIPIIDELSKRFGVTGAEVRKLASEGKINFSDLQAVLVALGGEGGRFADAMREKSETLSGELSTLWDNIKETAKAIGSLFVPALTSAAHALNSVLTIVKEYSEKLATNLKGFFTIFIKETKENVNKLSQFVTDAYNVLAEKTGLFPKLQAPLFDMEPAIKDLGDGASKAFKEIEKRAIDSADAVTNSLEAWKSKIESIKDSLATPEEKYTKTIEDLSKAVIEGGLDMEFFARGVARAREELERASRVGSHATLKPILKGSAEDVGLNRNRNDPRPIQNTVQDEIAKLKGRIEEAERNKPNKDQANAVVAGKIDQTNQKLDELRLAIEASRPTTRPVNL